MSFFFSLQLHVFFPSVFLRTVDGRNPKQPPGMSKTMEIMGFQLPTSSGEFTRFFNHQQYVVHFPVSFRSCLLYSQKSPTGPTERTPKP